MGRAYLVVEIAPEKAASEVREYGQPSDGAAAIHGLLSEFSAREGAVLTFRPSDRDSRLIVAVDGLDVFLGLDGPDGTFQYEGWPDREGTLTLCIGGQETPLAAQFVVGIETATDCIEDWLRRGDAPLSTSWRRQ